jgi:hypothetical protein
MDEWQLVGAPSPIHGVSMHTLRGALVEMMDEADYFEDVEWKDVDKADMVDILVESTIHTIYNLAYDPENRDDSSVPPKEIAERELDNWQLVGAPSPIKGVSMHTLREALLEMVDEDGYFEDFKESDADKADRIDLLVDSIIRTIYNQAYDSETRGEPYPPVDTAQQLDDTEQKAKRDVMEEKVMKLKTTPNPTKVEVPATMSEWNSWSAEKQDTTVLNLGFKMIYPSMSKEEWEEMARGDQLVYVWKMGLWKIESSLQAVPQVKAIFRCIGTSCQTPRGLPRVIFPGHQA